MHRGFYLKCFFGDFYEFPFLAVERLEKNLDKLYKHKIASRIDDPSFTNTKKKMLKRMESLKAKEKLLSES